MSASFSAAAVFERTVSADRLPADLRLHSLDWGVLFAATGRHSVGQIGAGLGVSAADRDAAFARLVDLGLLVERPVTAEEYLRAAASAGGEPLNLAGFLTAGLWSGLDETRPAAEPLPPLPEPAQEGAFPLDLSLDEFEPLALPDLEIAMTTETPRPSPPVSLRALMRFVVAQARDADAGQLDVYRAFVRLDPQLLKRNGITTLRFEEDRLLTDPDLKTALLESVEQVVGRSCPAEVFVVA